VVPVLFYHNYTRDNVLARIWVKFMPIASDDYFSFVLPGALAMYLGFKLPLGRMSGYKEPRNYLIKLRQNLAGRSKVGLILIGIGVGTTFLRFLVPDELGFVLFLLNHLTYVGVFYVYYSDYKYKKSVLLFVLAVLVSASFGFGMFGELIFLLALSLIIMALDSDIRFATKLSIAVGGLFMILVFQNIKTDYRRKLIYSADANGSDPAYFAELLTAKATSPSVMFTDKALFGTAVRMNQGWLIATTMYYVPEKKPFANGETIWQSLAATIVPRFLWPDKPEAGGKYNLERFWGYKLRGYSMNIGPIGEAYGNFDRIGGIVFMFFYGLFFNLALSILLKKGENRPTIICWLPYLFFYAVGVETDVMSTTNSLVKGVVFMLITFWAFKRFFKIQL